MHTVAVEYFPAFTVPAQRSRIVLTLGKPVFQAVGGTYFKEVAFFTGAAAL